MPTIFPLNLTVKGFAQLDDEAYNLVSGYGLPFTPGVGLAQFSPPSFFVFNPGVLIDYPDSLNPFEHHSPEFFLAPKPVCDAHESAKLIAKEYRDDFVELLIREAKLYWTAKRVHAHRV